MSLSTLESFLSVDDSLVDVGVIIATCIFVFSVLPAVVGVVVGVRIDGSDSVDIVEVFRIVFRSLLV